MKRWKAILLVSIVCIMAACGSVNNSPAENMQSMQGTVKNTMLPPPGEEPEYVLSPLLEEKSYSADDGTVLAECSYQLATLSVSNSDELSPDTAAKAEQAAENFNERMNKRLTDSLAFSQELEEMAADAYKDGFLMAAYSDTASASAVLQGRIYSIRVDCSSYTGGAHPNSYTDSYLFDLDLGQFIDPAQVADDPVAFQAGAAELLLEKAQEQEEDIRAGYYPEYAEVIFHWYDGSVLFDGEGMTVVFSPYVLGPYAMGTVELKVSYDEIKDLLGPGGLERLGMGDSQEAE